MEEQVRHSEPTFVATTFPIISTRSHFMVMACWMSTYGYIISSLVIFHNILGIGCHRQSTITSMKMFCNGNTVNYWAIINFSRQRLDAVERMIFKIVSMCRDKGMRSNPEPLIPVFDGHPQHLERSLVDVHADFCAELARIAPGNILQLLFCILPETSGSLDYGRIKRVCDVDLGIISQRCHPKQMMKPGRRQYFENIALKINVKVGGSNMYLSATFNRKLPNRRTTSIFGADVTHPQPSDDTGPLIASVVASLDWPHVTKYRALVSLQPHMKEIVVDLNSTSKYLQGGLLHHGLIRDQLLAFKKATGHKPHRIIFYRDGVGEGMFSHILLHEMDNIQKACVSIVENYMPPVTFIVVQNDITHVFPMDHGDKSSTDRSGNILPGTVVDTNICHPSEFDFYLCSHAGIQNKQSNRYGGLDVIHGSSINHFPDITMVAFSGTYFLEKEVF